MPIPEGTPAMLGLMTVMPVPEGTMPVLEETMLAEGTTPGAVTTQELPATAT